MSFAIRLPFEAQNVRATQLPGDLLYYNLTTGKPDPTDHVGVSASAYDFALPLGTDLIAIGTGTVVSYLNVVPNGEHPSDHLYGNFVTIKYDMGDGDYLYATYCHLELNSGISVGTVVHEGDHVGNVGLTGDTTGPHLHIQFGLSTHPDNGGGIKADAAGDYDIVTFGDPTDFVYNSNYNEDEYTYSSSTTITDQLHAQAISLSGGSWGITGSVGAGYGTANWNSDDFYSFVAPSDGTIAATLSGLSNDIDLRMLNGNGQRINESINDGTTSENITESVTAGQTYLIHVDPYHYDSSDYSLGISFTGSGSPNLVIDALNPGATSVGILGGLDTSFTIGNDGSAQSAATTAHLYLSSTQHLNEGAQEEIGTGFAIPQLNPGQTYSTGISWIIPAVVSPGTWYVVVSVDPVSGETRTDDDSYSQSFQIMVCFLKGAGIATPGGEMPVENIREGDIVLTASGARRPVRWVGIGQVLAVPGRRNAATPVIIRKGALADGVPSRDLRVTKGHSLFLDGALIPVEFLINYRTILWDDRAQEVSLYHVELDSHDVLIANGAPAESYRDDGNRWLFRNASSGWGLPPQEPCAPVLTGGLLVDTVWRRLLERDGPRAGLVLTDDPDLHLLVDGRRIDATWAHGASYIFRLPSTSAFARILSRSGVPSELGVARDPRKLGVALRKIAVRQGACFRVIDAENPALVDGFHGFEPADNLRWTDGDAGIPAALLEGFSGPVEIVLHVGCISRYQLTGKEQGILAA